MAGRKHNPTFLEEAFGAVVIVASVVTSPLLRPWYRKWGATVEEVHAPMPADELVPHPKLECTRAITIQAPAGEIWPWLVQMGHGRGGMYSYERLENLMGCDLHNADQIVPGFQDLKAGAKVWLGPEGYPNFDVVAIDPGASLVLRGGVPGEQTTASTWVFYLDPIDDESTRLIVRSRTDYKPSPSNVLIWRIFTDPISFVMERKMLQGIRARAEASASG